MTKVKNKSGNSYRLLISEEQAAVVMDALELFMRIGMGQYGEILEHSPFRSNGTKPDVNRFCQARDSAESFLQAVKQVMTGLPRNSYYGISSPDISDKYRTACDIREVIRHRLSWDKNPEGGMTVNFDRPFHWNHAVPLPTFDKDRSDDPVAGGRSNSEIQRPKSGRAEAIERLEEFKLWARKNPVACAEAVKKRRGKRGKS